MVEEDASIRGMDLHGKESMKSEVGWMNSLLALDESIRTVHLIEQRDDVFVVTEHVGREEIQEYYGAEERIHQFLSLSPAVMIGASGTIKDVVGEPLLCVACYEKVIVAYVPLPNRIIALSFPPDAYAKVKPICDRVSEIVPK